MSDKPGDITQLLHQWREGDRDAESQPFALVMTDLRRLTRHFMRRERQGDTLQAAELVDQVYFGLTAAKDRVWRNRQQFFATAARAMRGHLIEVARGRPDAEFVGLVEGIENLLPAGSAKVGLGYHCG